MPFHGIGRRVYRPFSAPWERRDVPIWTVCRRYNTRFTCRSCRTMDSRRQLVRLRPSRTPLRPLRPLLAVCHRAPCHEATLRPRPYICNHNLVHSARPVNIPNSQRINIAWRVCMCMSNCSSRYMSVPDLVFSANYAAAAAGGGGQSGLYRPARQGPGELIREARQRG